MKKIFSFIGAGVLALMTLIACTPDSFDSPNSAGIPVASDYDDCIEVTVDQESNYAYFTFKSAPGVSPVWIIDGSSYSGDFQAKKYYRKAGDYSVECKVKNKNGISDGSITKTFHVDKTKMNGFEGFDVNSDNNLFKSAVVNHVPGYYAPGWSQIDDPKVIPGSGNDFTVILPSATTDQWQAQVPFETNISTVADDETYDFSVILTSSNDHPGVTVKFTNPHDDNDFYFAERVELSAGEPKCVYFTELPSRSIDNLKLFFDFGGNPENTEVMVENLVFIKHSLNEIEAPAEEMAEMDWNANSPANLWKIKEESDLSSAGVEMWWADNNWSQIGNPNYSIKDGVITVTTVECGGSQWQGQFKLHTNIAAKGEAPYDFFCVVETDQELPGLTIKFTEDGDDDNFFCADRVKVPAGVKYVFKAEEKSLKKAAEKMMLVLDFGGSPAGSVVKIHDIYFAEHKSLDGAENLWNIQDESGLSSAGVEMWWADNNWGQVGSPNYTYSNGEFSLTAVECGTTQWQAQVKLHTNIPATAADSYTFQCVVETEADIPGMTFKLTQDGDDNNFFFADRVDVAMGKYTFSRKGVQLSAGKDAEKLMMVFDLAGVPAGTKVSFKDFVLVKD